MPTLTIDDQKITVEPGTTIIQACDSLGIEIPRFCYHERLNIAGNCRMCLVEVSPGPPKPQASCALPCAENMVVKTNSPMVKKAREGVMEFLLINHPLDCPICDQGGECDLQDQAMFYGSGKSRYMETKRAVPDKYMGPLINTFMNRCIHCTRCIRFSTEIAGVPELGAFGRGEHMEVGTYVEKALSSELSGNLVDICPVGALTSRPYTYLARPWELKKTETIDVMDAVGSNIRVDSRAEAVLRVLPRLHEDVNEEWISDKTRHACDGLRVSRLDRPYIRNASGKLVEASWEEALAVVAERLKALPPQEIAAVAGNMACNESMFALKSLMDALGCVNLDCRQEGAKIPYVSRTDYLFNTSIAAAEDADVCLIIGADPRKEAAMLNARLRKAYLKNGLKAYVIGKQPELHYPYTYLGNDPRLLGKISGGEHAVAKALQDAKNPLLILGSGALARADGDEIFACAKAIAERCNLIREDWNGFNLLHAAAARVGGLDLGFTPGQNGRDLGSIIQGAQDGSIKLVYLLGVDEIDMALFGNAFIVYQGHHGDDGAHNADVVLPGAAYTEKDASYVNMEGRVQLARRAVFPPGQAKEDWAIIRALSEALSKRLPVDSLSALRSAMWQKHPHLARIDTLQRGAWAPSPPRGISFRIDNVPFEDLIPNFYMSDPISRASRTMAECTRSLQEQHRLNAA